jgi:hypothetical protein
LARLSTVLEYGIGYPIPDEMFIRSGELRSDIANQRGKSEGKNFFGGGPISSEQSVM